MIAAILLAASLLAPAGVTAGIQADPVCLPVTGTPVHRDTFDGSPTFYRLDVRGPGRLLSNPIFVRRS